MQSLVITVDKLRTLNDQNCHVHCF